MPTELLLRWTGKPPLATPTFYETLKLEVGRLASWLARALSRGWARRFEPAPHLVTSVINHYKSVWLIVKVS
jgi:hypothetical protein